MLFTVFFSWQSDLPNSTNRGFIEKALKDAAEKLNKNETIDVDTIIDRDIKDVSGSPNIIDTILGKIDKCDLFVADLSIINGHDER
jgi:hypothetical protein